MVNLFKLFFQGIFTRSHKANTLATYFKKLRPAPPSTGGSGQQKSGQDDPIPQKRGRPENTRVYEKKKVFIS
jgi:hypothetical protein